MAIYKSRNINVGYPRSVHGDAAEAQHLFCEAQLPATLAAGDVIQLGYYPRWARIVSASLQADQLDTNATGTLAVNVGDTGWTGVDGFGNQQVIAADPQRFFSAQAIGRVPPYTNDTSSTAAFNGRARLLRYSGPGFNATNPNIGMQPALIQAVVTAAAATPVAGALRFLLTYFVDEPRSLQFPN
jgi:hypothetical protein